VVTNGTPVMRAAHSSALHAGARERACTICTPRSRTIFASLNALATSGDRIFGGGGELDQLAAGRLEVRLKATAGASDQSEPPGAADRFRHFKRGPLDPASIKLRGDLQNCQDVTFLQCSADAPDSARSRLNRCLITDLLNKALRFIKDARSASPKSSPALPE
jgi:hypothetical protein